MKVRGWEGRREGTWRSSEGELPYMMEVARWARMLSMVCRGCCLEGRNERL